MNNFLIDQKDNRKCKNSQNIAMKKFVSMLRLIVLHHNGDHYEESIVMNDNQGLKRSSNIQQKTNSYQQGQPRNWLLLFHIDKRSICQ